MLIGGGSVKVFFKSNATEVIPSPKTGYRCFKVAGNVKSLPFITERIRALPILT